MHLHCSITININIPKQKCKKVVSLSAFDYKEDDS